MHHIPLAHHDSSHDLAAVCPAPAPPVPHVHSITQSRTQSVVRTVCEPGSAEALSLLWLQKAASHDLGIHASAFLNHWTSGTLSLQGRQVSQSVLIVSSAGVRREMIDPAPTNPALLKTTSPGGPPPCLDGEPLGLAVRFRDSPLDWVLGQDSPGLVTASCAHRDNFRNLDHDAASAARVEPLYILWLCCGAGRHRAGWPLEKHHHWDTEERRAHGGS